ncbi:unnamed protein product [Scytosiphon promiscuus]
MKTAVAATALCCFSVCPQPALSLIAVPQTRMRSRWSRAAEIRGSPGERWPGRNVFPAGRGEHRRRASHAQGGGWSTPRKGVRESRRRTFRGRRRCAVRARGHSGSLPSSSRGSDSPFDGREDDEILSFEEFEKVFLRQAPGGGGVKNDGDGGGRVVEPAAAATGIDWRSLAEDVLTQPLFVGVFALLATPAIREQVKSSFRVNFSSAGLGILGSIPLFVSGFVLETRRDWDWVRTAQATTERVVLKLFGSKRQLAKVTGVSLPLALLVGFAEECGFRGFLPLILSAKTGLPTAAVVILSGLFCGVLHAVSLAYFVNAALNGIFFHCLLLSTGNIFVPIVAHAVHNAFALVHCHLKTSGAERAKPMA